MEIRRIDTLIYEAALWSWKRLVRFRDHLWLWWQYTFREAYAHPVRANDSLKELCGYRVLPSTQTKLRCVLPWFHRWRFGFLVFFVPHKQQSRYWTLTWVKWIGDPLELFLVRSAARGTEPLQSTGNQRMKRKKEDHPQPPAGGLLESMSSEELDQLLT